MKTGSSTLLYSSNLLQLLFGQHSCNPALLPQLQDTLPSVRLSVRPLTACRGCCCSQKDVQQLKTIFCTPALNPDIRRSAADQLLSLTAHERFHTLLSEPAVIHTLLHELTNSLHSLTSFHSSGRDASATGANSHHSTDEQQLPAGDVQLPTACLHLLLGLVQHCDETKRMLLSDPDRWVDGSHVGKLCFACPNVGVMHLAG